MIVDKSVWKSSNVDTIFSIIVPTFNEEIYIGALLKRLFSFALDDFLIEVIVIDNGSTDGTLRIVKEYPCRFYVLPDATIAAMRNYGARIASGSLLGFIDADCMPIREWAIISKAQLDEDLTVGVTGSYYSMSPEPTWVERLWCTMRHKTIGLVNFLPAGNMAVRKNEFVDIGGFPEKMITGEDYALCQLYIKENLLIVNNPLLKNVHLGNAKTLEDIRKKEKWYGMSYRQSIYKNIRSKVFWASCVFLFGFFLAVSSLFLSLVNKNNFLDLLNLAGLFVCLFVVFGYAWVATLRSGKFRYIAGYILIFFSYFFGRSQALIDIIFNKNIDS